uniref:Nucleolar complex-associated protein 3 N-terminal domain-containing protein n=1 Tax=Acrobeloides nanus TaxID=290746 RepID=A0A914D5F7_9BILA
MLKKNPVVINKQKRKATRKLLKSKKKGKLNLKAIEKFETIKSKRTDGSRKRFRNVDDDFLDYRQKKLEEEGDLEEENISDEEEILPTDMLDEDIDFENSAFFKKRRKLVENIKDDETEHLRKFKSQVGEDEAEMLPIKLGTGELVRLKKKVEPMVENELEEEEDDKSVAKTKVDEEDFSNLSASELLAKRRELLEEIRGKIASAAHALTINPHENIICLRELYKFSAGEQVHSIIREPVQKLATASLVQVFVDIVPGYHIRPLTDVEKDQKMKKETKKLIDYEQILLRYYLKFLQLLEKNSMKIAKRDHKRFDESTFTHKMAMISAKCLCRLLTSAPHFNYATNIVTFLSRLALSNFKPLVSEVCAALAEMFKNDTLFKISLHAVKTIASLVNKKKCYVSPELIATFLSLKIREVDRGEKKSKTDALKSKKFKLQKERKSKSAKKVDSYRLVLLVKI